MTGIRITDVEPDSHNLACVMALHRASKATLGPLPDQGFAERAESGTLLGATLGIDLMGYCLFDLVGDSVKVRHLCVHAGVRGQGVGRALVEEIKRRHYAMRNVVLHCRRDYGLDSMWQSFGFRAVGERRGRSHDGAPLTIWVLDFGHPTLFTTAPTFRDLACIDQVVHEDLVVARDDGYISRQLLGWPEELVELCVTDELFKESNDTTDGDLRRRLVTAASGYRNLSRPGARWKRHLDRIERLVPRAGSADHRHLARAIEGGAAYFVTRDEPILMGAAAIRDAFEIEVMSPDGLLDALDRQRSQDRYEPAVLQGTDLIQERLAATDLNDFVSALLHHGEGERAHVLRDTLRRAFSDPQASEVLVVRDSAREVLGGVARRVVGDRLEVHAIRVRRVDRLTDAAARQLLFQQRKAAADRNLREVVLSDVHPSPAIRRALTAEFFEPDKGGWACSVGRGLHTAGEALGDVCDAEAAAVYERRHWPAKVIGAGLTTYMVSIEPSFAERLFDEALAAGTLFARDPVLGLSREHVYYRSIATAKNMTGPARVLWYVKQRGRGHPVGHVRAVSHLVEVVRERPRALHKRFARLGVWSQEQVEQAAGRNREAMALRLTDTEILERPVDLSALRSVYASVGQTFMAPQAPVRLDERVFCLLYRRSSAYA